MQQRTQQRSSSRAAGSDSSSSSSNGHLVQQTVVIVAVAAAVMLSSADNSSRRHSDGAPLFRMTLRADEDTAYFNAGILGKAAAANLVQIEGVPVGYSEHTYDCCSVEPPL
eukprot:16460-Heterococcus_DN1.PRE.1